MPEDKVSLDYAGDVVALERLRVLYPQQIRPSAMDEAENSLLTLIASKAEAQAKLVLDSVIGTIRSAA